MADVPHVALPPVLPHRRDQSVAALDTTQRPVRPKERNDAPVNRAVNALRPQFALSPPLSGSSQDHIKDGDLLADHDRANRAASDASRERRTSAIGADPPPWAATGCASTLAPAAKASLPSGQPMLPPTSGTTDHDRTIHATSDAPREHRTSAVGAAPPPMVASKCAAPTAKATLSANQSSPPPATTVSGSANGPCHTGANGTGVSIPPPGVLASASVPAHHDSARWTWASLVRGRGAAMCASR